MMELYHPAFPMSLIFCSVRGYNNSATFKGKVKVDSFVETCRYLHMNTQSLCRRRRGRQRIWTQKKVRAPHDSSEPGPDWGRNSLRGAGDGLVTRALVVTSRLNQSSEQSSRPKRYPELCFARCLAPAKLGEIENFVQSVAYPDRTADCQENCVFSVESRECRKKYRVLTVRVKSLCVWLIQVSLIEMRWKVFRLVTE
jgi:hypothetical protein